MVAQLVLETMWFLLPALFANMAPVLAAHYNWVPSLAQPLDGYQQWRGHRLLGDHKTIRGAVVGLLFGSITSIIQYVLLPVTYEIALFQPSSLFSAGLWGAYLAVAALSGDAIKSFFKRQAGVASGTSWIPWDQTDAIIGVLIFTAPFISLSLVHIIVSLLIGGILMVIISYIGVCAKIKQTL